MINFIKGSIRFLITLFFVSLIGIGIYDYLKNVDTNDCSMTYMRQSPSLIPVNLPQLKKNEYKNYKLFLYCEGYDCQNFETLNFKSPGYIPVLFIPGNADSHLQVRSIASVALDKSLKKKYQKRGIKFLYFTISFNEELSGMYGPLLEVQTAFVKLSIRHILSLFKNVKPDFKKPKSIVLIGNSMGGIITRGIFLPSEDNFHRKKFVHTIITQASPHNHPVINIDKHMSSYYEKVNNFWLNKSDSLQNVVLASLYGGTRDILVRSGLANINEWNGKSTAGIITGYTLSIPFVWRAIDHRCMAWCKELVMAENRALFEIIDPTTDQIIEDRSIREKVFRNIFEGVFVNDNLDIQNLQIFSENIQYLGLSQISFEYNDYTNKSNIYVFNLNEIFKEPDSFDSLFIYSNVNEKRAFLLCREFISKSVGEYDCVNFNDLTLFSHKEIDFKTIPPYFEGHHKESSLNTINIMDMKQFINKEKYGFLVIKTALKSKNSHQLILKLDWYKMSERLINYELPSLTERNKVLEVSKSGKVFQRIYLPKLTNILQAYSLTKLPMISSTDKQSYCDDFLVKNVEKASQNNKPLSLSTTMIQFYEPLKHSFENSYEKARYHIYHSQSIQTKSKDLILSLTANQIIDKFNMPYIDLVQFDLKHLIKHSPANELKCTNEYSLKFEVNYVAILGQYIRFFIIFTPAFLVSILQFYDYLNLKSEKSLSGDKNSFMMLNNHHTKFGHHLIFSLTLTLLINLLQLNQFKSLFQSVENISYYFSVIAKNDFDLLSEESIWIPLLPFLLYWTAYTFLSIATFFLSFIFSVFSFFVNRILLGYLNFLNMTIFQNIFTVLHLGATLFVCFYSSTLAHCSIFYAELIRLAINNPKYLPKYPLVSFIISQTRLILFYIILILNLPSLIVWAKSLESGDFNTFYAPFNPFEIAVASASTLIYLIYYLKSRYNLFARFFNLNNSFLANLILFNNLSTVLYSSISIYRLQYFILVHLFLTSFNSSMNDHTDGISKKSKED